MNSIQEQYEAAGVFRDRLRAGLPTGDSGGPAPSSADHRLIEVAIEALERLKPRPSPNGIGTCASCPAEVARLIREAALLESCRYCGAVYTPHPAGRGPTCDCPENKP